MGSKVTTCGLAIPCLIAFQLARLVPLHPLPLGLGVAVLVHLHWAASQTPSCPQKMAAPRLGGPHRGPGKADSRGWCPWSWGSLVLLVEPPPHIRSPPGVVTGLALANRMRRMGTAARRTQAAGLGSAPPLFPSPSGHTLCPHRTDAPSESQERDRGVEPWEALNRAERRAVVAAVGGLGAVCYCGTTAKSVNASACVSCAHHFSSFRKRTPSMRARLCHLHTVIEDVTYRPKAW